MKNIKCSKNKTKELPIGIISDTYIEIFSYKEVVLTGDVEIMSLGTSVLKIKNNEHKITFNGENLEIINYSVSGIRIKGRFSSVEFE